MILSGVFLLLALGANSVSSSSSCEGASDCSCVAEPTSLRVACPKSLFMDPVISARYQPRNSFQIQCVFTPLNEVDFSMMKGLKIGPVNFFGLKFCPIRKTKLKELMAMTQISQVSKIEISYINDLGYGDTILPGLFEGLETVTHIKISNNENLTTLPENIFDGMPKLTSISLLDNRLKTLPRYIFRQTPELTILEILSNPQLHLEPGAFKYLQHLRLLTLYADQLVNLTRAHFADVPNLEILDLTSNNLRNFPPDTFIDLKKLTLLSLNANEFVNLPYGLLSGTTSLKTFRLNNNRKKLQTLPSRFLSNLTLLSDVTITNCGISSLPHDLLWDTPNVASISLEGNQLTQLPDNLFRDVKELQTVNISHNKLESLPDLLFASTSKLKTIQLSHNFLRNISRQTFQGLSKLQFLNLEHNELAYIDPEAFRSLASLTKIQLSDNHLTFIDSYYALFGETNSPLQYCTKLEIVFLANNEIDHVFQDWQTLLLSLRILDLSGNKIKHVTKDDLWFFTSDLTLNLDRNEIKRIDLREIETFARLNIGDITSVNYKKEGNVMHVNIGENPIECDCSIYDLVRYHEGAFSPEVKYLFDIDIKKTRCEGPSEMRHTKVSKLNARMLLCSLDQVENGSNLCPQNCSCSFRRHDYAILVDCSNQSLYQIPPALPIIDGLSKKMELSLRNNNLKKLPTDDVFVKHNITKIDVSYNQIEDVSQVLFPRNLQVLYLDHNNLTKLTTKTLNLWDSLENLSQVTLDGNLWQCNCETLPLLRFIRFNFLQIPNHENITCWPSNKSIKLLQDSELCPVASTSRLIISGSISIAVLGLLIGLLAAMYYRYQREIKVWLFAHQTCLWFVTEEELDRDKEFDAFVSYSHLDAEFVENILVPRLESGPKPFHLCLHYRDWEVGGFITNSIIKSVESSRRTLIVLSKNFISSDWSKLEFQAAHKRALNEGRANVIIILYGDIGPKDQLDPELKAYLSTNTYVEWGDPWFWDRLRYALPHPPELRRRIPGELREQNIRRVTAEKLDLVRKSNGTLNMESTPPANSITTNPLDTLNSTNQTTYPLNTSNGINRMIII